MKKELNQREPSSRMMNWLSARQSQLKVTRTTKTPAGKILDWVPIESQTEERIATPPPANLNYAVEADEKQPTVPVGFDIGESGPEGHVPVLRPDMLRISETVTLEERSTKRGGLRANKNRTNKNPTDPNPAGYFHATSSQWANVYGCEARLNVWDPRVNIPSSPGDDHSISQTWLQNYQTPQVHSIEAGLTVDTGLNGDSSNHLFTYYTTDSYAKDGDNLGGYNRMYKGWVQYHPSIYPGIAFSGSSVRGGAQLELGIKFQLYQGNWWFGVNYNASNSWTWIGYYPGSLFKNGLNNHAEWVSFGGEVYSALANPCDTTDQMGSGTQSAGGYREAAYQRNLRNQSDAAGTLVDFNGIPEVDAAANNCSANDYTITCTMSSGSNWGSYQYYGGPSPVRFIIPTEGIWQWVDYGTMVDDGVHPWNPDFRNLLTGIVLADLAKYSSRNLQREFLELAAKQIASSAKGITDQIAAFSRKQENGGPIFSDMQEEHHLVEA